MRRVSPTLLFAIAVGTLAYLAFRPAPPTVTMSSPSWVSLEPYIGSVVAIEGAVSLAKEGDVLETKGVTVRVDVPKEMDWPDTGTRVLVTGTLRTEKTAALSNLPYYLDGIRWQRIP